MKQLLFNASLLLSLGCFAHITEAPKRILTLGIRHESNTFSTALTRLSDFQIKRGADVLKDVPWAKYAQEQGMELIPTVHAYSWPGGVVEKSAFESLKEEMLTQIANAGQLDGIYMEMHGALHVQGYEDAQASFIKAIRELVGNQVVISASFDLHGNLSPEFVGGLNLLSGYRTAPHRDIEETKLRAVTMLINALREKQQPVIECITIPILVPGEKSITEQLPLRPIYQKIPAVASQEGMLDASIFAGYCWADLPRSAMRVFVVARDSSYRQAARKQAMLLADEIWDHRAELQLSVPSGSFPEMLKKAVQSSAKTVFISDSGDNTTAGAPGDNTQVLEHLLKQKTQNVLLAGIVDPASFETCINLNLNETVQLNLGGKVDYTFSKPLAVTAQLLAKSTPEQIADKRGAVLVEINGIKTVVLNNRRSFTELRDFTELGLDPLSFKVVIVKLGYLFPQLAAIAPEQLMALTDGFCNLDIPRLPYQQVRRPAYPLDTTMQWSAASSVPDFSLHYGGKAATTVVGDGVFIVKTSPEYFLSVKGLDLEENYVSTGGTIVLFGATTHKKTDEDGAGILGEQHGLIDWYNYLPLRTTTPLLNWSFTSTDANPIGTQWQGSYTSKLVLPAEYNGKDLHIELGPLVGLDSVFINGAFVASFGDMEKYIVQEYPTNTTYRDTHRYKMLSRYYVLNADNPVYTNLPFGKEITIEVRIKGDGLNRGIPAENNASIGVLTTEKKWQPTDEALPGLGLAHSKRKGINYWGSEQFFNSWSTKHGLFGFKVNGNGVQFAHENQTEAAFANTTVQDIYTDFAVLFPWQFEALAYTTTSASLLYPATTERYPCIVRIIHHNSGGGFVVISPALIQGETGSSILNKLSIIPN